MQTDATHPASCLATHPPCNNSARFRWGAQRSREVLARAGTLLREARKARGLSLRDVAAKVERSHVFLGCIERGDSAMPIEMAPGLCEVLGLDIAVVLCAFRLVPDVAAERFFDVDRMRAALAGGA